MERESHPEGAGGDGEILDRAEPSSSSSWDPQPGRRGHLAGPPRAEYRTDRTGLGTPRQAERFLSVPGVPLAAGPPPQPGRRSVRRFFDVLLVAATAAALVTVVFVAQQLLTPSERTAPTQPPIAIKPAAGTPSSVPTVASAAALTLRAGDLPAGFRAVQAGTAQFGGVAGSVPDSWDVVFQSGEPSKRDFRAAESIVLLYATPEAAIAALRREQAAEPNRGARQLVLSDFGQAVGQDGQVWEEPLSGAPDYRLVRVLFRVGRAMSEVTMAAPAGPAQARETVRLAAIQADRLAGL